MRYRINLVLALLLLFVVCASVSKADNIERKILASEAYQRWRDLAAPVLSADGEWVAYTLSRGDGAQELVVRKTRGNVEFRQHRGFLPKGALSEDTSVWYERYLRPTQFTSDSRYLAFAIAPPAEELSRAGEGASRPSQIAYGLGILRLSDGALTMISQVASFSLAKASGQYLAYVLKSYRDTDAAERNSANGKASGRTLVLHDLSAGTEVQIAGVIEYSFDYHGKFLSYLVFSEISDANGAYVRRLSDGHVIPLLKGAGTYSDLTFDDTGEQLAFLSNHEDEDGNYSLYYTPSPLVPTRPVVKAGALERGNAIDPKAGVRFAGRANAVIFSVRAAPEEASGPQIGQVVQKADIELWHWRSVASRLATAEVSNTTRATSYLAVYYVTERRWVRLGSVSTSRVLLSDDAHYAVGIDYVRDLLQSRWALKTIDLHLIDTRSGTARLFRRGMRPQHWLYADDTIRDFSLPPQGRYLAYFEDRRWWILDLQTQRLIDITGALLPSVSFDLGGAHHFPVGLAGWTPNDQRVLLYDQYDIWAVDPSGNTPPTNLTDGLGKRENIVFRLWEDQEDELQEEESGTLPKRARVIHDAEKDLLLIGIDLDTMASGIWRERLGASTLPEELLMVDKRIIPIARSKRQPRQYVLTMETFSEYPDLWVGPHFRTLHKISDANPQQREYRWGSAELVTFTSDLGAPLKGRLYKPEGFDPSSKYPMIVSLYEISSLQLHRYSSPAPLAFAANASSSSWPAAVSNGYVYFVVDVLSTAPHPAQSAVAAVLPAIRSVMERGFVDPTRIGLIGHSFGAYEVSAILTETSLFRCAVAGAGSFDPISLYGSVDARGSIQLEIGQWRHNASIWKKPFVYIVNSSFLHADRVQSPLLYMHNDQDNATPLSQGMAFFFALQRNGKPVWLVRYPGEGHILSHYGNRIDWDRRVMEFLEYYLKDGPEPMWMQRRSIRGS